jgi:hypothetical protein
MKSPFPLLVVALLLPAATAAAQGEVVPDNYFPTDIEFAELHNTSKITFKDPARLLKLNGGRLFEDVGFEKYERRSYSAGNSSSVSIEVISLKDSRAAYSLLTLFRESTLQNGPPGDAFTTTADGIRFAKNRKWVRIQASGIQADLLKRIADSMSDRIGRDRQTAPSLVSHLPKLGFEASSLRYFPGLKSFETYSRKEARIFQKLNVDMEIAQAHYSLENGTGNLSLLSFPTIQVAEECFTELTASKPAEKIANSMYAKNVGPMVALLKGSFDPSTADKILSSIRYSSSVRWIEENKPAITWGVPAAVIGAVVKSLFFVMLLCGVSIVTGAGFALFRLRLRKHSAQNIIDRQSEITQLRLQ